MSGPGRWRDELCATGDHSRLSCKTATLVAECLKEAYISGKPSER